MDLPFFSKPTLTEPGVKYFLHQTLKNCHSIRTEFENNMMNLALFIVFCVIVGATLLYKYKGKPSKEELQRKAVQKQQYILEKINSAQLSKQRENQALITNLPVWENEYHKLYS
jgi:hypothetical protein